MNKEKIKELWHKYSQGDKKDVEYYNEQFGHFFSRPAGLEDRLLFTEHRLLNLMVCLNEIMQEITQYDTTAATEDPCPGCVRGWTCRTPACGRLKLSKDHPLRNTT